MKKLSQIIMFVVILMVGFLNVQGQSKSTILKAISSSTKIGIHTVWHKPYVNSGGFSAGMADLILGSNKDVYKQLNSIPTHDFVEEE